MALKATHPDPSHGYIIVLHDKSLLSSFITSLYSVMAMKNKHLVPGDPENKITHIYSIIPGFAAVLDDDLWANMVHDPRVKWVEIDEKVSALDQNKNQHGQVGEDMGVFVQDPPAYGLGDD